MVRDRVKRLSLMAVFIVLIIVGAFIKIPLPYVPVTMQYIFVALAGLLLGGKEGMLCVLVYIFMGLVGLPVFTAGGGFSYVLYPTFGYLIGFALGALVIGTVANARVKPSFLRLLIANFLGLAVIYFFGVLHFYLISNFYLLKGTTLGYSLVYCFLIFLPTDIVFSVLAAFVSKKMRPIMVKSGWVLKREESLLKKVLRGGAITESEAFTLLDMPLKKLTKQANKIRKHFCKDAFHLCAIASGKSGKCGEDCKFCAQSAHYAAEIKSHGLLEKEELLKLAKDCEQNGISQFSIVTSSKALNDDEVNRMCEAVSLIKEQTRLNICVSFGLLNESQFLKLKNAGVSRAHNNLETGKNFYQNVCTTHTYQDKVQAILAAKNAGLEVCSGGIMGLGENELDRIDMALALRELNVQSVPLNFLHPIQGTPLGNRQALSEDEAARIVAIYRFILPKAFLRLAGGRMLFQDGGKRLFLSGANAAITGTMLTTLGNCVQEDKTMLKEIGFQPS